jgi:hypothetical protein
VLLRDALNESVVLAGVYQACFHMEKAGWMNMLLTLLLLLS